MNESTEITINNNCIGITAKPTDMTDLACMAVGLLTGCLAYVGLKKLTADGKEEKP